VSEKGCRPNSEGVKESSDGEVGLELPRPNVRGVSRKLNGDVGRDDGTGRSVANKNVDSVNVLLGAVSRALRETPVQVTTSRERRRRVSAHEHHRKIGVEGVTCVGGKVRRVPAARWVWAY
jgi:hypothetical protein